jgi:SHS family lactate transporter-like MFS transporter
MSLHTASITTIIGNCGAITGCAIGGYVSQYLGRRLTIIMFCCLCCAMLPLWLLPTSFAGLAAGAFFVQAGVQG